MKVALALILALVVVVADARLQEKTPITFDGFKTMLSGLETYITGLQAKVAEVELPEFSFEKPAPIVKEDVQLVSFFTDFLAQYQAAIKSGVSFEMPEFNFEALTAYTKKGGRRLQGENKDLESWWADLTAQKEAHTFSDKNSFTKSSKKFWRNWSKGKFADLKNKDRRLQGEKKDFESWWADLTAKKEAHTFSDKKSAKKFWKNWSKN